MARRVWVLLAIFFTICTVHEVSGQNLPAAPSRFVDTTYPTQTGTTINVPAGGNFQSALDQAQLGDTITLQAGATYTGNFTLPVKSGSGWILIRTTAADSSLPAQGRRMTPAYASSLPKIVSPNSSPAIQTAPGAHHYRLVALELTVVGGLSINYNVVLVGDGSATSTSQVPTNIILDRVYIHGQPNDNLRRGVGLNGATSAVIDSYISNVHEAGNDNQAIMCWNGPGPIKIANNYLEAAGENVLFGGADPAFVGLVPSDIEIRGNYFFKPTSWRTSSWQIKNILELKNAQRVLVDGNVFEHNWPAAQNGYSILFTVRNQSGGAPWSTVQDVTFTHNIVRHVSSAINILGTDDLNPSQQVYRILISNNVFEDVSDANWGGLGNMQQVIKNPLDVTVDHNTGFPTNADLIGANTATQRFVYRNNLETAGRYGVAGDNHYGDPAGTLSTYFVAPVFTKNALQGANCSQYPANNFCPATISDAGFVNYAGGDYHLSPSSPYKNASTDGKDLGADIDSVNAATAGAISGNSSAPPPPPPPTDTTAPSVSITAPANGATVSGTTSVTANASDNVGVAGVQFFVDGSALGAEDTAAPYSVSWNTTQVANGAHALTARARDAAGNTSTSPTINVTVSNAAPPPATQSPYFGTPFTVPGQFEAENFDRGGEGVAYHDAVAGNAGGLYRPTEDVDIISPYAGGYVVNNFQTGEWLEYTINVTSTATYKIETLISTEFTTSAFHVDIDGVNKTGTVAVPSTGLWTTFQWIAKDGIALSAGQHVLRITADTEYFNFDAMRISTSTTPPPPDTTPPSVSITAPLNAATVSGATSVTANASDNVGVVGVQFYVDGSALGSEDTAAPYAASWDTTQSANGSHTLTARARDAAGNTNTSAAITVTVSNTAPAATQSPYTGTPFAVPGQFEAEDFDKGGEGVAYHDVVPGNAGGSYRPNEDVDITGLFAGGYVVNNFQTGEWLEYTINVTASGTYAIEALVSSVFTSSQFQISIDDVDKTSLIAVPNTGSWETFQWVGKSGINLTAGPHVLRLTTAVEFFNVDALRITQELPTSPPPPAPDTTAPAVSITAPSDSSTVSGIVLVTASASDNVGVAGVRFFVDGAPLLAEDTSDPYSVSWDTTLASNATHLLTAVARDAAGNSTTSGAVQVSVRNIVPDTTLPTVAITAPSNGASVSGIVQVTANATDNVGVVGVQFYLDGVALGAEATSAPYVVMWDTTRSANGSHILTAVVRDAAGNTAFAAGDQVMVANGATGSSVSITSPTAGATVAGTVQVTANAPAGAVGVRFYVDGNSIGLEDNFAPFGVSWDSITSPDGSHTLTAVSRDLAGNITTSAPVSVTVKNAAPRKRGGPRH